MRFSSTPESALNQEITWLAIIESVFAVALYVGLALHWGTFKYLAVAVALAPLTLLRTDTSAEWGLKKYEEFTKFVEKQAEPETLLRLLPSMFLILFIHPIYGSMIRIDSTIYWGVRRPLQTLKEMPQNWLRQSFCTDFMHPPEILPMEAAKGGDSIPTFKAIWDAASEIYNDGDVGYVEKSFLISLFLIIFILGYGPSMIYRVSFKATTIAYLPFVWAAHATLRNPLAIKGRLERITKGELEKVRRVLSGIVLTTLLAKAGLVFGWVDRKWIEDKFPGQGFIQNFVILDRFPWWQITLGMDSLLTFGLLWYADAALARIDTEHVWREEPVRKTISTVSMIRAIFSIATVSHFFYIALLAVAPEWLHRLLTA